MMMTYDPLTYLSALMSGVTFVSETEHVHSLKEDNDDNETVRVARRRCHSYRRRDVHLLRRRQHTS